jgi:hypothetical protein
MNNLEVTGGKMEKIKNGRLIKASVVFDLNPADVARSRRRGDR